MKVSLTVFLFFASLILTSCSAWRNSEKENKDTLRLFPSAELRSDLEFLVKNSQEVHPSLYSAVDSITFTSSVKKVMDSLNHSMTRLEFYRLAAPLLSLLKNGHSCIFIPEWNGKAIWSTVEGLSLIEYLLTLKAV
ncbi:MAG: hypothetical protein HF311_08545 [Ignavibacteria bacterium]|jgi:hypothetical protein|nr:hypothetical protein [Ignavibacteria bacterium]